MLKSLAGTKKMYHQVTTNAGLRARLMKDGLTVRIHVKKNAPKIDSRNRDDYWAMDVNFEALKELVDLLSENTGVEQMKSALIGIADILDDVGDII